MAYFTNRRTDVLDLIKTRIDNDKTTTQRDIVEELGMKPGNVSRMMRGLENNGLVVRKTNKFGAGTYYTIAEGVHRTSQGWLIISISDEQLVKQTLETVEHGTIKAGLLQQYLETWAQKRWEPKFLKSYHTLPLTIAGLFKAAIRLAQGENISEAELSQIKNQLQQFKIELDNTLLIVNRILNTSQLQNPVELTNFLIPHESYIAPIESLVQSVFQHNLKLDSTLTSGIDE